MVQQYKLLILVISFRILSVSTNDVPPISATVQLAETPRAKFGDHEDVNNNLASSQVDSKMVQVRTTVDSRARRNTRRALPTVWKREKRNKMHGYQYRPSGMDYYMNKMQEMVAELSSDGKEDDESEDSENHAVYRNPDDGTASVSYEAKPKEENDEKNKKVKPSQYGSKVGIRKHKAGAAGHKTKVSSDTDDYQNKNDKIAVDKTNPKMNSADNLHVNSNIVHWAKPITMNRNETPGGVATTKASTKKDDEDDEDDEEYGNDENDEEEEDESEEEEDDESEDADSILEAKGPDEDHVKHKTKTYTNDYSVGKNLISHRNHGTKTSENSQIKNSRKLNHVNMKAPQQHSLTHTNKAGEDDEGSDSNAKAVLDEAEDDSREQEEDSHEEEHNEDETNDDEFNEDGSNEEGNEEEESKVPINENSDGKDIVGIIKSNVRSNPNMPEFASAITSKMCPVYIMVAVVISAVFILTCGCYFLYWMCIHRTLVTESKATSKTSCNECYSSEGSNTNTVKDK